MKWPFRKSPSNAARTLGEMARTAKMQGDMTYRNRVRAKAKAMREEMGLTPSDLLEPR